MGNEILRINAHDIDSGLNGEIFFYFDENTVKDTDWKYFIINSNGQLFLNTIIDREQQAVYVVRK